MTNKKIGIITWHYYGNYGSMLQTYALYHAIENLGHNPIVLNYRNPKYSKANGLRDAVLKILSIIPQSFVSSLPIKLKQPQYRFSCLIRQTKVVFEGSLLTPFIKNLNSVICGSDQIWAPNVYNPVYMLDFVPDNINKISYAASIGLDEIPQELVANYKKCIGRLDYVSVREQKGKEILKMQCNIESQVVLDPTLLININEWRKLESKSNIIKPYIFCYFLKADHFYKTSVQRFAEEHGLEVYGVSDNPNDADWMHILTHYTIGPREFLGLINDASIVITDSYHGTIFSLLYHKDFITIERFSSDDRICQNSRIYQLIDYFGISDNIVKVKGDTILKGHSVDYEQFEKTLSSLRQKSISFLIKALS